MPGPSSPPPPGPGAPTPPVPFGGAGPVTARLAARPVEVPSPVLDRLQGACAAVVTDEHVVAEASRDWWPIAMTWALDGRVPALAAVVARPSTPEEVGAVLRICSEATVPVTAAAGRSGVCGASVPVFGGVVLDLCGLAGVVDVDDASLTVDVRPGTFGDHLEHELRGAGLTLGHWPQSMALSTVGGWLACRSAGQLSTRYGKIEDMVTGLDVVLADGTAVSTGGFPRAAVGPDLTQLFVGSEGTLGVITGARLRVHPAPRLERRCAWGFASFADGLDACRRILRRGARPAVLRLYDAVEADRGYATGDLHLLLVLDEGDPALVEPTLEVVSEECSGRAAPLDAALVERWLEHRNDVSALAALIGKGFVVDTMEVSARWAGLPAVYERTVAAIGAVEHTIAASAHQSHAYGDGACLYFSFAGRPPEGGADGYYRAVWDAGTTAALDAGASLSHHHGVGLNRARFVAGALGPAAGVLAAVKRALDPAGILNPGKLGLAGPFGEVGWP